MSNMSDEYNLVSEYCQRQACPKLGKGKCGIEGFCGEIIITPHNFASFSMSPDIIGMDLDVAYEMIAKKEIT